MRGLKNLALSYLRPPARAKASRWPSASTTEADNMTDRAAALVP
jgi:hypothetical protein